MMVAKEKKPASKIVYEYILNGITNRVFPPGMPMREEAISSVCNCSATPIREAFRQLEKEGWLTNLPYRGCIVRILSEEEISEIFFMREAVESRAVRCIIQNKNADLAPLHQAVRQMEALAAGGSHSAAEMSACDLAFHRTLLTAASLPRLTQYAATWDLQIRSFSAVGNWQMSEEELADVLEQHKMILHAIERGWSRSAEALILDHTEQARIKTLSLQRKAMAETAENVKKTTRKKGSGQPKE